MDHTARTAKCEGLPGQGIGNVVWLPCGEQPAEAMLAEVERLIASLGGESTVLERSPGYAVLAAQAPEATLSQVKGALALVGGAFAPADAKGADGVLHIFVLADPAPAARLQSTKI